MFIYVYRSIRGNIASCVVSIQEDVVFPRGRERVSEAVMRDEEWMKKLLRCDERELCVNELIARSGTRSIPGSISGSNPGNS